MCQAWYRKIQSLGSVSEYNDKNSDTGKFLKLFFGLIFYNQRKLEVELFVKIPDDKRVKNFTDFIVENYLEESRFSPERASSTNSMCRT